MRDPHLRIERPALAPLAGVLDGRPAPRPQAMAAAPRRPDWLPRLAGCLALVVGALNIASALTPDLRWRGRLLMQLAPVETVPIAHALALVTGVVVLALAFYLAVGGGSPGAGRSSCSWRSGSSTS